MQERSLITRREAVHTSETSMAAEVEGVARRSAEVEALRARVLLEGQVRHEQQEQHPTCPIFLIAVINQSISTGQVDVIPLSITESPAGTCFDFFFLSFLGLCLELACSQFIHLSCNIFVCIPLSLATLPGHLPMQVAGPEFEPAMQTALTTCAALLLYHVNTQLSPTQSMCRFLVNSQHTCTNIHQSISKH